MRGSVCWEPCVYASQQKHGSLRRSLNSSFGIFSPCGEKYIFFSIDKGETCSFLVRTRKERKEAANVPFDRLCSRRWFGGGYKRRRPRSRSSRDPSAAAPFANIVPEGAHTARALRLRAQASSRTDFPRGEWWPVRAPRALQHLSSRVYVLSSRSMGV